MNTSSDAPKSVSKPGAPKLTIDQNVESQYLWQGKILPIFWTIACLISILVNVVLFTVTLILAKELFTIKNLVQMQLVDGLYENFVKMDEAHIMTTIQVNDTLTVNDSIPVTFDLPLKQRTEIMLTKDTPIKKASVILNGQPVPTDIILKEGTRMSIALDLVVPVNQQVPIKLTVPVKLIVPVDIPLVDTQLHEPFAGLQDVIAPYKKLLDDLPNSWGELMCAPFDGGLCNP